jgi:hypothetical protein
MCRHEPRCPAADLSTACAAQVVSPHPEQGWCLLCNGAILFEDGGLLMPDGTVRAPLPVAV